MSDILRAIVDDYVKWIGIFDEDGLCVATTDGDLPPMPHKYWAEVPTGAVPNDVYYNKKTKKAEAQQPVDVAELFNLGESIEVGAKVKLTTPQCTVAFVNGFRQPKIFTLDTSVAINVILELKGKQKGAHQFNIDDYATKRKVEYPTLADQLDALWKTATFPEGSEAAKMQQEIMSVKERNPKPSGTTVSGVSES